MALTKIKIESILADQLKLKEAEFHLRKVGNEWLGNVVSPTFKGKGDLKRQVMIRDALEAQLGEQAYRVGMILAYTPEEWYIDEEVKPKRRKAG